jgi:hypothetical protein
MLSDEATPRTKGKIFGFHRSMDTLGAVLGPSLAILTSTFILRTILPCFIAFIPGLLLYSRYPFVKEKKERFKRSNSLILVLGYWKVSPMYQSRYRSLLSPYLTAPMFSCCLKPKNQA